MLELAFSLSFSFSLLLESFRPRPMLHHFWFSSTFRGTNISPAFPSFCVTAAEETFVTSPSAPPQRRPSKPALLFFFFTTRISPSSSSSAWST